MNLLKYVKSKSFLLLLISVIIAGTLRLSFIGNLPYGFANDEVSYILSGYTIEATGGFDIEGKFLPLSVNLDSSLSPVPVYILSLFIKLFSLSTVTSRLPFALMGVGSVVLVFLITKQLFEKDLIAFFSAMVVAHSPWHILITRGVWDVVPAQFFYLAGFYVFLKKVGKGSILWALPFYLLGFFSYHGTKVFFVFFVGFTLFVFRKTLLKRRKELFLFIGGMAAILAFFGLVMATQSVTRQTELIFTNENTLKQSSKQVNFDRENSSAPLFLRKIESNKATYFVEQIADKYFFAFSPNFLLLVGDIQPIYGYGIFFKGVIYFIDLLFLLVGIAFLFLNNKNISGGNYRNGAILILGSLLISPLPSTLGAGNSYIIRSFMMVPFLSVIIGIGAYFIFVFLKNKGLVGKILITSLVLIYAVFVSRFLYQYYYQFNYYGGEFWNISSRILSEYIIKNSNKYDNIVIATSEDKIFLQYAFESKASPSEIQKAWEKEWPVRIGKVTFSNSCLNGDDFKKIQPRTLYIAHPDCHTPYQDINLISDPLEPLRVIWKFYEI